MKMFERWAERMRERRGAASAQDEINFNVDEGEALAESTPAAAVAEEARAAAEPTAPAAPRRTLEGGSIELKVVRPATFEEVGTIADYLLDGCTVVLNFELLDRVTVTRMLDFLYGVAYTMDGEVKNVAPGTYIITPNGIDMHE